MKTCTQCREAKPLSSFGRFAASSTGLKSECLECSRRRSREYHQRRHADVDIQTVRSPCARCGQGFDKSATNHKKIYCSRSCMAQDHAERRKARAVIKPPRTCECGRPVTTVVGYARCDECRIDQRPRRTAYERRRTLLRYGVTQAWWDATLAAQGDRCAICRTESPGRPGAPGRAADSWSIDHDHAYSLGDPRGVRGLLCVGCNLGIGQLGDDPARLLAAAMYIERHSLATNDRKAA